MPSASPSIKTMAKLAVFFRLVINMVGKASSKAELGRKSTFRDKPSPAKTAKQKTQISVVRRNRLILPNIMAQPVIKINC
jgi:hypothetical protein